MKNPLLVVICLLMSSGLFAQSQYTSSSLTQGQIKVAVYVSGILSDSYNTVLGDNLMEAFAASNKYIAVNRSDALNEILKRAQTYQENGHVNLDEVVSAAQQYGETQLCAVNVIKVGYTYVFRASLLEIKNNTVIKSVSEATENNIDYKTIREISQKIIARLIPDLKQEAPSKSSSSQSSQISSKHRYIAWSIAGTGYPWNLTTGIEFRYGKNVAVGGYLDIGMDFTHISVKSGPDYDYTTKTSFRYAGGLKFYAYKGLFLDCGYGTIAPASTKVLYGFGDWLNSDEAKSVREKVETSHGLLFHAGYNLVTECDFCGFFLGISAGASYDVPNKVVAPSFFLKMGIAFGVK